MNWQKEFPQENGDWLWVSMWGCACCIRESGIAWIHEVYPEDDNLPPIYYQNKDDKWLGISWEGRKPCFLDKEEKQPDITAWMKIDLPPKEWSE